MNTHNWTRMLRHALLALTLALGRWAWPRPPIRRC